MLRVIVEKNMRTREKIENPYLDESIETRLIKAKTINLRNNFILEDLQNGYFKITPKDANKLLLK